MKLSLYRIERLGPFGMCHDVALFVLYLDYLGIRGILQQIPDRVGIVFPVERGERPTVDGFESLAFIIYRCGNIPFLQPYGGEGIIVPGIVCL